MDLFNFISITRKKKQQPESKVQPKPSYMGLPMETSDSGDLTKTDLGNTFIKEPLIQKGIWKKNKDLFGGGWHIVHKDPEQEVDEDDQKIIDEFNRTSQIKGKFILTAVSSDVYGDGFIEKIYEEPLKNTSEMPVMETWRLVDLKVLDGEFISKYGRKNTSNKDKQEYYILKQKGVEQYFHPDRLEHIAEKKYPGKLFGISRIYIGRYILNSKIKADHEYGDFIEWTGSGVFDCTHTGANQDDINYLSTKAYVTRKKIMVHDEKDVFQVLNPTIFNPDPFNQYFYINISALVDMPWYILAGVSPGQLTGSEIGMSDYYKTLMNLQETIYTPHLEQIYTELLRGEGRSFEDYKVEWNPIYTDETNEATIFKIRVEAAQILYNINSIDEEEARMIARNGITDQDGNSVLSDDMPEIDKPDIIIQPQPPTPETPPPIPEKQEGWMTLAEKLRYENEKMLGIIELNEQEQRIKDAAKKAKKKKR